MNDQHTHEQGIFASFFPWLKQVTNTNQGLIITIIVVFLLSILMEAIGAAMRRLAFQHGAFKKCPKMRVVLYNATTTLLHTAEMTLMLTLMVIFMTLNTWLCASIITGSAIGYLLFNWNSLNERESKNRTDVNSGNK